MAKRKATKKPTKQTVVRHHSDWMRLVERSGPFLSMPVLLDVFPQGLAKGDRDQRVVLRDAYESWQTDNRDIAVHRAWVKFVLTHLLEIPEDHIVDSGHIPDSLKLRVDLHHEDLAPDMAVIEPGEDGEADSPQMILMIVPPGQALDKKLPGKEWAASPQTRMSDLVRGCNDHGITFGLLTNGEQWMLAYSKQGETASYTTWYSSIWFDETITLRSFRELLSARRLYGDPERTLDKLFERSADDQHEVTDQLGLQVRDAIETLVSAIDEIDRDRKRKLLAGFSEEQLYEACVTVMMRLVFLFFAEERRLLPVQESFYEQNYSLHALFDQLQTQKNMGEEELEWAYSGWCRLLALFRAIHGGVQHDDMQLHAYGSSLFDPDRFPFLEGRPQDTKWRELESQPLPINDRTLLHVLEALKLLEVRGIGGGQRITRVMSFRELDVEDIGHIYESLLDHTAKRAKGPVLGIVGSKDKEPELSLDELEKQAEKSREVLVDYLKDETGKTKKAITKLLDADIKIDESRLLAACGNDQAFLARVKPFGNLVRENRSGDPIIIPDGSVYVTEGTDRRSSGTHYTPKSLTEPIVQHTLEPLAYEGPAEGKPQDEWKLKTPAELLDLNICDMACGSGAFLVQACRFMAERLVEAWEHIEQNTEAPADDSQFNTRNTVVGTIEADQLVVEKNGKYATGKTVCRPRITPLGEVSKNDPAEELIPLDPMERMVFARRIIADRCLYGVDKNPLAVEMAKLSLWLLTLAKDKPFNFLNHAIRPGDSLVGIKSVDQLIRFSFFLEDEVRPLFQQQQQQIKKRLDAVRLLRTQLEKLPSNTAQDIDKKSLMMTNVENQTQRLTYAADMLLAASWQSVRNGDRESVLNSAISETVFKFKDLSPGELQAESKEKLANLGVMSRFHWPLEFPEVFDRGGFDAFICNPPFLGTKYWASRIATDFKEFVVFIIGTRAGMADLCALFVRRAFDLLGNDGVSGMIGTESLREGQSQQIALTPVANDGSIIRAIYSMKWPGSASVRVCVVWFTKSEFDGNRILDSEPVSAIDAHLSPGALVDPFNLEDALEGGKGSDNTRGESLILHLGDKWLSKLQDSRSPYCRQYVTADDLTSHAFTRNDRWVVDTIDLTLEEIKKSSPVTHRFLIEHVKDDRLSVLSESNKRHWWRLHRTRKDLYERIRVNEMCIVMPVVSKYLLAVRAPSEWVYTNKFILFEDAEDDVLSVMRSNLFDTWVRIFSGSLGETLSVSLTKGVETFPLPTSRIQNANEFAVSFQGKQQEMVEATGIGLTDVFNQVHDPTINSKEVVALRRVQVEIDRAVVDAYGWKKLDLNHDFYKTRQGLRFTVHATSRQDLVQRLLKLNHERNLAKTNAKKVKSKSRKRKRIETAAAGSLFDDDDG